MASGIPNMWLFWTPYSQVTWHGACAVDVLAFKNMPMYKIFTYKRPLIVIVASGGARPYGERSSASLYRGSGGRAPSGVHGQSPWSGVRGKSPPEAEAFLAFGRSLEAANLPTFRNLRNTKTSYVIFAKNHGWPRNWGGGWSKTGAVPPSPGLKPPLSMSARCLLDHVNGV